MSNSKNTYCYHCGDDCDINPIIFDEHKFCCHGCRSVYKILQSNDMQGYYTINSAPGTKPDEKNESKYAFLENDEIANRFYKFKDGDIGIVNLFLPEIHCSSCIWLLENLFKVHTGVRSSEVNFVKKSCNISFDITKISLAELSKLLDKIGYPPKFERTKGKESPTNYKFMSQLAISGFALGNIMLMSFPEYLSTDDSFAEEFRPFFSYFILALSIPVLVYSLKDYIISAYKALRAHTLNLDVPITLGIISLYGRSLYDIIAGNGPGYMDSFAGFAFFLLVGKWFQNKTYEALSFERDYKSYFPLAITRLSNDSEVMIPIEDIEVGDVLLIRNEEIIPSDSIIIEGEGQIDYSFVTGESRAIQKQINDEVFAGGKQLGSAIKLKVLKRVEQSYLTSLWNKKTFSKSIKNNLTDWTSSLSFYFILAIIILAIGSSIAWYFIDPSQIINVVISVLIVACPCALALAIPFTFGNAMRIAGNQKMYIKNTGVIEQLGKVTDLVFDKTGTITYNNLSNLDWVGEELNKEDAVNIYSIAKNSMHPLSESVVKHLNQNESVLVSNYYEEAGLGVKATVGAVTYRIGSDKWVKSGQDSYKETRVYISKNEQIIGFFKIENVYRREFIEIATTLNNDFVLHLLSGDNDAEREKLQMYFSNDQMLFGQSPSDKLDYINKLKEQGKIVMMLGDGLNDAGALSVSDIGVVVSENVHNFSPASDAILSAKRLNLLPRMLDLGVFSVKVLKWSYAFSFLYNIIGLYFALTNQLTPLVAAILMPISSISVVILTTVTMKYFERKNLH